MNREDGAFFRAFRKVIRQMENWPHRELGSLLSFTDMPDTVKAGFAAPCPEPALLVADRTFVWMLPTRSHDPMLEDHWHALEKPFLCPYPDRDQVAQTGHEPVRGGIPCRTKRTHHPRSWWSFAFRGCPA